MRLAAVSVDLDGVDEYRALHGLPSRAEGEHAAYDVALARAADFAVGERLPLTLFAIGRDLSRARSAEALCQVAGAGHRVENHSSDHRYDLTRLDAAQMAEQIAGGADAIAAAVGRRPRGFRAPGYLCNPPLFAALDEAGVAWDSSLFPAPAYALAKTAAMALIALRGRRSRAIHGGWATLWASADPHRPAGRRLLELPIATTRRTRLPAIGTCLSLAGPRGAAWLVRGCIGRPLVNLELHAIDFLDASDGITDLAGHQPDVRIPLAKKLRAFHAALEVLRDGGYLFVDLDEAASLFSDGV